MSTYSDCILKPVCRSKIRELKTKLRGLSQRENYTDRATSAFHKIYSSIKFFKLFQINQSKEQERPLCQSASVLMIIPSEKCSIKPYAPCIAKHKSEKTRKVAGTISDDVIRFLKNKNKKKKQTPWSESASELYRSSHRRLSAK
jgi:hypothetical protein